MSDQRSGKAVVFGASGGIGRALVGQLTASGCYDAVYAGTREPMTDPQDGARAFRFDLTSETSIAAAAQKIRCPLNLVIVATGILQDAERGIAPEKSIGMIDPAVMAGVFAVNTIGPALIAKHFAPLLARERRSTFAALSARVGSIGDNRLGGWYGYRASKAGLNMIVTNLAIELARTHPDAVVTALHPGTVATRLSEPFRSRASSPALFEPRVAAGHLLTVIDGLTPADSGGFFSWDGTRLPW